MKQLRTSEAAAFLGVGRATLRRLEERGSLRPSRDANGHRLYSAAELEQLAAQRTLLPPELEIGIDKERVGTPVPLDADRSIQAERDNLERRRLKLERRELEEREAVLKLRRREREVAQHEVEFGEQREELLELHASGELKSLYLMTSVELRFAAKVLRPVDEARLERLSRYELRKMIESDLAGRDSRLALAR